MFIDRYKLIWCHSKIIKRPLNSPFCEANWREWVFSCIIFCSCLKQCNLSKTIIQEESGNVKADHEINFPKNLFSFQLNASTMTALSFFCSCLSIWEKDRILENTGEVTGSQTKLLSKLQPATGFFYCI